MTSKEFYQQIIGEEKRLLAEKKKLKEQWDTAQQVKAKIEQQTPTLEKELLFIANAKKYYEGFLVEYDPDKPELVTKAETPEIPAEAKPKAEQPKKKFWKRKEKEPEVAEEIPQEHDQGSPKPEPQMDQNPLDDALKDI